MASPETIDLAALLIPISADSPAGADIREDTSPKSVYYRLKDARTGARAEERRLETEEEPTVMVSDWRTILDLAPAVLAEQAKDLEVASWLTEALLRAHGFAGLRDGFRLMRGLVETFWDGLYPRPDEDGIPTLVAPLTGLNGEDGPGALIQPIRKIPITQGADYGSFAAWHYGQAVDLAKVTDEAKRQARIDGGAVTLDRIEASVKATPPAFFRGLIDDLRQASEEYAQLTDALSTKCDPADAPPSSNIRNALAQVQETVAFLTKDIVLPGDDEAGATADAPVAGGAGASAGGASGAGPALPSADAIASREDALRLLAKVADYFRRTEPHSPIAYTLDNLIRRGRLGLPELLEELIPDLDSRNTVLMRLGIQPPPPSY